MRTADRDLAARDPALPALPVLLDDALLGEWLAGHGLGRARRRYLRYKPGTSCLLRLDLEVGDPERGGTTVPAVLATRAADGAGKLARTRQEAPPGSVLAADDDARLLLTTPAADRVLPAVAALSGDRPGAALAGLLPGEDLGAATVRVLRYKPARRWVALLGRPDADPLLLRAHAPAVAAAAAARLRAFGTARVRTPALVAEDPVLGLVVTEWLPGRTLADLPPADHPAALRRTGGALATLHQHAAPGLPRRGPHETGSAVRAAAGLVAHLLPHEAERAAALARAATDRLRPEVPGRVCHGDFSADQVVLGPHGVALVDLDEVGCDDPAVDLAGFLAAATAERRLGPADAWSFLDGYRTLRPLPDPRRLAAATAAALLRRAAEPFRLAEPDWAARVVAVLDAAERELR
ncbi:aminoglycoside phosphotransferase family protein [Geodermatophilus sp. DSM 44513]|uniref:phosphotransferase n=1 Tax=Geodermatophilus sp. DSM 44513 TaxID=1528104 RepID=UPI00126EF725|nr:aminoglycoside phosphotransferase family protein [Geodermatophilus sp. DSM 44513]WNV76031.1 aminoglycoside phosphotransferase family protein [Geodermatophilus sp. DSM 44513]